MNSKKIQSVVFVIIGVVSLILSFACFGKYEGYITKDKAYGGDAYTGIQNALADVSSDIVMLNRVVKFGVGSLLLVSGLLIGSVGIFGVIETNPTSATGNNAPTGFRSQNENRANSEKLNQWKNLYDQGVLTPEEYERIRRELSE